jgi:hypothetical protein
MDAIATLDLTYSKLLAEARLCLDDADFYLLLYKWLPRSFPCPDRITPGDHTTVIPEIVYDLDDDECAESLRIILGLTFGAPHWRGVFNTKTGESEIQSEVCRGTTHFRIRILKTFTAYYTFEPYRVAGDLIYGAVKSRHFHPLQQTRADLPRHIILQRAEQCNAAAPAILKKGQVLYDAARLLEQIGLEDAKTSQETDTEGD